MSRLTRDGTAEPVSRDQILRHARGQGNVHFPCSADHEQDWQAYPVDPYSAICDDHTYIHTYIHIGIPIQVKHKINEEEAIPPLRSRGVFIVGFPPTMVYYYYYLPLYLLLCTNFFQDRRKERKGKHCQNRKQALLRSNTTTKRSHVELRW